MCCIFTCCGWIVDLIQRVWTFSMSCIIMSSVAGVMVTSSMSGIALGYNYSLAEYIDLKETNVSVYLKRGVFDDEIADDLDWRRAGNQPAARRSNEDYLTTGAPADESTLRSGRRLDDSVFEADDQNKYEGHLMKLTAKPAYQETPIPQATSDLELDDAITKHPSGSLNQLKAVQSLIDSRRAMATGGTTVSPLAIYEKVGPILPYLPLENNPNQPLNPEVYRRMMAPESAMMHTISPINPARLAVPDPASLGSKIDWLGPKYPGVFVPNNQLDLLITSPTYPPAITVRPVIIRPTEPKTPNSIPGAAISFPYPFIPIQPSSTQLPPTRSASQEQMDKQPDFYNDKLLAEGDEMNKYENMNMQKMRLKSPEEEYEDEIKGLPVRKRRSIIVGEGSNPTENNIIHTADNKSTRNNGFISSVINIFTTTIQTTIKEVDANYENNIAADKNRNVKEKIANSLMGIQISDEDNIKQHMAMNEKRSSDLANKVDIIREADASENKKGKSLLDHLITFIGIKKASLVEETTPKADLVTSTAKKIRIKTRRRSFESKIVSSKYIPSNMPTKLEKKQPFSNQDILNSISVSLNDAGLLRNPASSTFVKLLQSTLTA